MTLTQAQELARALWGEAGDAMASDGIRRVGTLRGEPGSVVYGEGKTWREAFEDAQARSVKRTEARFPKRVEANACAAQGCRSAARCVLAGAVVTRGNTGRAEVSP